MTNDKCTRPESGTVIDDILTNAENVIFNKPLPVLISDHLPVLAVQKKPPCTMYNTAFTGRSYRLYDRQELEERLIYHDWSSFYKEKDPGKQWDEIIEVLLSYLDEVCPIKTINIKTRDVEWITQDIREAIADRRQHMVCYLNTGAARELEQAKELRRRVNVLIDNSKTDQIDGAYNNYNDGHKQFWKKISTLINPTETGTKASFIHHETNVKVQDEETADYFNQFFANVGSKMAEKMNFDSNTNPDIQHDINEPCNRLVIEYEAVEKLIEGINVGKSSGINGVNARVLKDTLMVLVPQLVSIYRNSVREGIFPDKWAVSTVVPIPKAGDLKRIGNWRPINLLPVPGRLLEK